MKKPFIFRKYCPSTIFFLLFHFCIQHVGVGQVIDFNNQITFHNRSIILRNIMLDGDSLLITGEIGTDSMGLAGFFLLYIDTLGNLGTIKNYRDPLLQDHALLDGRNPVMITVSNHIVLSGHYFEEDDAFFMKLNNHLDTIFYNNYESNYRSMVINGITELHQEYYIVGRVQTINGDGDVFLQKIDSVGNKVWEKTFGVLSKDETGRAAIIEGDGLTIMVSESFDNTPNIKNDTRYWIRFMHVDTSGGIVRDWREEVTGLEGWSGTLLKYNNEYIYSTNVIGEETNFGPLVASQIVRRDSDFNMIWRKPFGAPDNHHNQIGDMIFSNDSSSLLASGNIWDETQEFTWARVMMIDLCGHLSCEVRDTGIFIPNLGSSNRLEGIVQSESGSIYTVGYTYKSSGFYEGLLLKINMDGCIDTLCSITDIEDQIWLLHNQIHLYPNPARSAVRMRISDRVPLPVLTVLYDVYGRPLISTWIYQYETTLDISGFPNGLYCLVGEKNGLIFSTVSLIIRE